MRHRDLIITPLPQGYDMVVACDMSACIGEAEHDSFRCETELVGAYAARVVLFELLAVGVQVQWMVALIGNRFEPVGRRAIAGIQSELMKAGMGPVELTSSTEDNMACSTTSVGVTAMGCRPHREQCTPNWHEGVTLFSIGRPMVGEEVLARAEDMCTYEELLLARDMEQVLDIIPVGSRGYVHEVGEMMGDLAGWHLDYAETVDKDLLERSGGPATAVLVAVTAEGVETFKQAVPRATELAVLRKDPFIG